MEHFNINEYLIYDIVWLISQYLKREDVLNFLNTCRRTKSYDSIFFTRYGICLDNKDFLNCKSKKAYPFCKKIQILTIVGKRILYKIHNFSNLKEVFIYNSELNYQQINEKDRRDNPLDKLPDSLSVIHFGFSFNAVITKYPQNLKHFTVGYNFNQPIDLLPDSVTSLTLGESFNHYVKKWPAKLESLELSNLTKFIWSDLPSTLVSLTLNPQDYIKVSNLPLNLKVLRILDTTVMTKKSFDIEIEKLPPKLESLELSMNPVHTNFRYPTTLTSLKFNKFVANRMENLPNSLIKLFIGDTIQQNVDTMPTCIKELSFGIYFNKNIDKLPDSIEILKLSFLFDQPIGKLPANLKRLSIVSSEFIHPLNFNLQKLQYLALSRKYPYKESLPSNIKIEFF